jgi:hypothetical protein
MAIQSASIDKILREGYSEKSVSHFEQAIDSYLLTYDDLVKNMVEVVDDCISFTFQIQTHLRFTSKEQEELIDRYFNAGWRQMNIEEAAVNTPQPPVGSKVWRIRLTKDKPKR